MSYMTLDQVCELRRIDKQKGGIRAPLSRFIRELTRKSEGKPVPPGFDEEGFEVTSLDYSPDLGTVKAECGFGWNSDITEMHFARRGFEVGQGEVQTRLHAPKRLTCSLGVRNQLEDMGCSGATIREGVAWALTHNVKDYPKDVVIVLLGSVCWCSFTDPRVPHLQQDGGQWYLDCYWHGIDRWDGRAQFLAVRRKFQR